MNKQIFKKNYTQFVFPSNRPKLQLPKISVMKLKLFTVVALLTATTLISCAGSDNNDYIDKSIIPVGSENKTVQPAISNTAPQNNNTLPTNTVPDDINTTPRTTPININSQNNVAVSSPQKTTQTTTAPSMNPPHGQPSHRCDIAVGAPLNSKPVPTNVQPASVSTQLPQTTMTEIPNTQKTEPGMNPPHGEPNHRCDIAVGVPLNSKPDSTKK